MTKEQLEQELSRERERSRKLVEALENICEHQRLNMIGPLELSVTYRIAQGALKEYEN